MTESDRPPSAMLTIPQAAEYLGVPERTLRRWVAKGRVAAEEDPTNSRGRLIREETLEQFRAARPMAGHVQPPDRPATANGQPCGQVAGHVEPDENPTSPADVEIAGLRASLEAAVSERDFLRARVEAQEVAATELRVLFLNTQQALQAAQEQLALPEPPPALPVPWWKRIRLWEPR